MSDEVDTKPEEPIKAEPKEPKELEITEQPQLEEVKSESPWEKRQKAIEAFINSRKNLDSPPEGPKAPELLNKGSEGSDSANPKERSRTKDRA
jgi:hypothetical protein